MRSDDIKLRQYKNDLYVSGTGAIILGAWSIIKALMELLLGPEQYFDIDSEDPDLKPFLLAFSIILFLVIMLIIMMMHLYVGINASKAARGMEYKKGYVTTAGIMFLLTLLSFAAYADNDPKDLDTTIASFIVDLTTLYVFAAIVISSFKIKKLKEQKVQK